MKMLWIMAVVALVSASCGSDETDSNGNGSGGAQAASCPDASGTWRITDHCEASAVGTDSQVTQSGCNITSVWGGNVTFTGTIDQEGNATISGDPGSGTMTCNGPLSGNSWTIDCTPGDCHVEFEKQ